ncbi:hypothetical protein OsJ_29225 [Oryza sativa Japonica Group]|uniref:Uncharacterized protein n=1 Tax=Oryza sativa subsp. japonica TaxID=39947 RepID=A3BYG1_ORYSJ|nr:hypothetical protein OsJ_29225 [Oryza sativa Japonica Group]
MNPPPVSPKPAPAALASVAQGVEDDEEKAEVDDGGGGGGYARTPDLGCPYYYAPPKKVTTTMPPPPPAASAVGGWDFFNLFYVVQEVAAVAISNEDMRTMREREGIPELEEAETRGQRRRRTPRPPKQQKLRSEWPIKKRPKTCAG